MQNSEHSTIKLSKYAHGAGCGCKIAPQVLKDILQPSVMQNSDPKLLVGNGTNDDAAVYDLGNGQGLIATTDFFTPIVDDAFDFGRIAAANAISDVYAMGGKPMMALAILGWPVNTLPPALAAEVIRGARDICSKAGIPLAGGHSIDIPEPVFGLSVNGMVSLAHLKKNSTACEGDLLFLTKAIGTGVFSTAQKRELLKEEDLATLMEQLTALNSAGAELGSLPDITAMTDVTGFGLLGHLHEMAEAAGLSAEVSYTAIPKMKEVEQYLALNTIPDATYRNWNAYQAQTLIEPEVDVMQAFQLLPDPQTNGGLLFSVKPSALAQVTALLEGLGLKNVSQPIGRFTARAEKAVVVKK